VHAAFIKRNAARPAFAARAGLLLTLLGSVAVNDDIKPEEEGLSVLWPYQQKLFGRDQVATPSNRYF